MKRQRLILLLLLVPAAGLLLWQAIRDPRGHACTLADGSEVIFLGTTVGTNHTRSYGSVWQQVIARLPASLRDKFADTTFVRANQTGQTNAVFWFRVRKNPARKEVVFIFNAQPTTDGGAGALFRFKFKDDQGRDYMNPAWHLRHWLPSGGYAYAVWPPNFPSASREVHLWLYSQPDAQPIEFRAPNPMHQGQR